jgi:hypothetical protein
VNVLMISWDTTRPDRLDTDTISALLDGGVTLADHHSCSSWTWPSVLCVQAGAYDVELGVIPTTAPELQAPIPDEVVMAGEVLSEHGYQTAVVSTNGWFSDALNMTQGAEISLLRDKATGAWVTDSVLGLFEGGDIALDRPWAVHAHYMDPHSPFRPPDGYLEALESLEPLPYDLDLQSDYEALDEDWSGLDAET